MAIQFPGKFTIRGQCLHSGGLNFRSNNHAADPGVFVDRDNEYIELYPVVFRRLSGNPTPSESPQHPTYSENLLDQSYNDLTDKWSNNCELDQFGAPDLTRPKWNLQPYPGTVAENGCDTPYIVWSPPLGQYLLYFTANPGTLRPSANSGKITEIGVATSKNHKGRHRHWNVIKNYAPRTWLATFEQPSTVLEGSTISWQGGVTEPSAVWNPVDGEMVMFTSGTTTLSTPRWQLGRAVSPDGVQPYVLDPETPVAFHNSELPSSGWGSIGVAFHPNVILDPDGQTLHMTYNGRIVAETIASQNWGIGHSMSTDWGRTWTRNPNNPLLTYNDHGFTNAPGNLGGPAMIVNPIKPNEFLLFYDVRTVGEGEQFPSIGGHPQCGIWLATGTRTVV